MKYPCTQRRRMHDVESIIYYFPGDLPEGALRGAAMEYYDVASQLGARREI